MENEALAIIVLNWNNVPDTLECLDSLLKATRTINSTIFITDNGSEDHSISRIKKWLNEQKTEFSHFDARNSEWITSIQNDNTGICILENGENLGFAKGNNAAVRFALNKFPTRFDRFLLLNNDTIIPDNSLVSLLQAAKKFTDYKVWTPLICYAEQKNMVWNAGGFLKWWGERKYIGHKQPRNLLPNEGIQQISFITGCALLMDKSLPENGIFLNEDFFFGEEDYYFSKQMRHLHIKMGVAFESVIYHKVSTSIKHVSPESQLPLFFIHYLNRIVDMKKWMKPFIFLLWKPGFILHAVFNVWWKRWYSFSSLWTFVRHLWKLSGKERVNREDLFDARKIFNL
ncbi:MAG: glycosyltransferase [Bacteroidales bacterium]|nr:glycosyltransferase [Bacteroidales bacterium]